MMAVLAAAQVKPVEEGQMEQKRRAARQLVGNDACLALDLVQHDAGVTRAMCHAFGRTFICKVRYQGHTDEN